MNPEVVQKLSTLCGAVAVSRYLPVGNGYDTIKSLTDAEMKQVNIHMLLAEETYEECFRAIDDRCGDPRLKDMNAIVFLSLKERGRAAGRMHSLRDVEKYKALIDYAMETKTPIGFDSCSAPLFLAAVRERSNYDNLAELAEPCESTLFSIYIDVEGNAWPCSFLSHSDYQPVYVPKVDSFEEVWKSVEFDKFRGDLFRTVNSKDCLVKNCRECPKYKLYRKE
jgi:MoaA/NifB/PqqE/SkfB family radical SAM enzyme